MRAVRLVGLGERVVFAVAAMTTCVACGAAPADPGVTLEGSTTAPRSAPESGGSPTTGTTRPGTTASPAVKATNLVDAGYTGRFRASGMVLERKGFGPLLCLGAIAASLPPGCGGPPIVGWSWTTLAHASQSGVQWGSYDLVGRFDGHTFTLTEPAQAQRSFPPAASSDQFATPCPAPAGGWRPVNPAAATETTFSAATALAQRQPGYATLWVDQNVPIDTSASNTSNAGYNDPKKMILNVATTGDRAAMTRAVRTVWGGSLCVIAAPRPAAELDAITAELSYSADVLSVGTDGRAGFVEVNVILATTQRQQQLDARYGDGVVRLFGALRPID